MGGRHTGISASSSALQNKEERLDIVPSFPACSKSGENCYATGCCQVSGHKCYTKSYGVAQCNETCTPGLKGFQCGVVGAHSVPVASKLEGKKLYCFSVYTENTGSTKKSYELELLQAQKRCLDHHYVDKVEGWDLTTDGACASDRPEGEKKNKKWHAPDCSAVTTPAAHPFKKPEEYMRCMSGMTGQQFVA